MLVGQTASGHQRRHLLLFHRLPVDELLDVGMVDVEADHLGGAPRGAAALDGAGRPVADLQKRHQPGGSPASRQGFPLAAQVGEIGAGARAVLEEASLAGPQIHDAALVDEVVGDRLDEAVVDHDIAGEVVAAVGLNVVDGLDAEVFDAHDGFVPRVGYDLAADILGKRARQFVGLV